MADHWKTLANRLGTPGIDEPEVDEIKEEKLAPEAQSSATAAPYADRESKPAMEETPSGSASTDRPASVPQTAEPPAAPAKPAKRKSSWEALANLFNVSVDRSEPEPVAAAPEPEPAQPEPFQPEPIQSEPFQPEPRRPKPAFGSPAAVTPTPPKKKLSIFDEPELDPNAALDAMFGDAPREKLSGEGSGWGKPKRVVDDLGWDDADDQPKRAKASRDDDRPADVINEDLEDDDELSDDEPSPSGSQDADEAGDDEPARRSRRRRRRGRRGRGRDEETTVKSESDSSEPLDADISSEAPVSWKHDLIEVESAGPWAEPESFESDVFESDAFESDAFESDDEPLEDALDDDDSEDSGEVVRRSNRRRRRRGRGREEAPAAEASAPGFAPRSGRDAGSRDTSSKDSSSRDVAARDAATPREARSERSGLPPRREPAPRSEQPARSAARDRESTGRETAGRESAGRESAGRESAGRDAGRRDSSGRDSGGRDSGGRGSGGRESNRRDAPRGAEAKGDRPRRDRARPAENIIPRDDFDEDFVEPIDELDEVIEEVRPTERAPSGRRRRGGRRPVDSPARSLSADGDDDLGEIIDDELDDDMLDVDMLDGPDDDGPDDDGPDDDGDAAGAQQHRNIPTWSDSLESIIQANTENHKRNEGRGGPRGGNRPRGRR